MQLLKVCLDKLYTQFKVLTAQKRDKYRKAETTAAKNGIELLDETFGLFGAFMNDHGSGFHIVFDEFQEISELRESRQIEGILRSHIQTHENASYFFVGSRRRLLLEIFNEQKRPFYKSAINYALGPLPKDEAIRLSSVASNRQARDVQRKPPGEFMTGWGATHTTCRGFPTPCTNSGIER